MKQFKKAWVKQLPGQVRKLGKEKARWYVEWKEPDGAKKCRSCGAGPKGRKLAQRLADRISAELLTGTYERVRNDPTWVEFVERYSERRLATLQATSRKEILLSLRKFAALVRPL